MKINPEILNILQNGRADGNLYYLPPGQLDRKTYVLVNDCLSSIGGKWNKKSKAHLFDQPPGDLIENLILTGETRDYKKELNFFPTPKPVIARMIELAGEFKPTDKILEPSCGKGAIVGELVKLSKHVFVVELDKLNFDYTCKNYSCSGWNGDFLKFDTKFDKIIMNPPFNIKGKPQCDIDHIYRAFDLLEKGGVLVSVVSESPFFRTNIKSVEFMKFLEGNDAEIEKLPESSFSESGTQVETRLVKLTKI